MRKVVGVLLLFFMAIQAHAASTVAATVKSWIKEQAPSLGLLKNAAIVASAKSVFENGPLPTWDLAAVRLEPLGLPVSLPGGLKEGYQFRKGIALAYGQAYLLHYQEGDLESDDHWFRLCKRRSNGTFESLLEFGSCVDEARLLTLSPQGPKFLLLVESACGSRVTMHLLRLDGKEPLQGFVKLQGRLSDLLTGDLDEDGRVELIQRTWEGPPAMLGLRVELASDFGTARPAMLWLSTAWKWTGEAWAAAGERWERP
jgi:hypothetical protein